MADIRVEGPKKAELHYNKEEDVLLVKNEGLWYEVSQREVDELLELISSLDREEISIPLEWGLSGLEVVTYLSVIGYLESPQLGVINENDVLKEGRQWVCPIDPDAELLAREQEQKKTDPTPRPRHPHDEGHQTNWEKEMAHARQMKAKGELPWCEQKRQDKKERRKAAEQKRAEKAKRGHIVSPREKIKIKKGEIPFRKTSRGRNFPLLERFKK